MSIAKFADWCFLLAVRFEQWFRSVRKLSPKRSGRDGRAVPASIPATPAY